MIKFNIKNLDKIYVVFKKVSGTTYFVTGRSRSQTSGRINYAKHFTSKEEAELVAKQWKETQKVKFRVEPLSKLVVNSIHYGFDNWTDKTEDLIQINSRLESINSIKNNKNSVNLSIDKSILLEKLNNNKNYAITKIEAAQDRLKQIQQSTLEEIETLNLKLNNYETLKTYIETTDLNAELDKYLTKTDKTTRIIYGKKQEEI